MQMYKGYEYIIFTDEDVSLIENTAFNETATFTGILLYY